MKPLRFASPAALLLCFFSAQAATGDQAILEAQQFRTELASRVQELGKQRAVAVAGLDQWLFLVAELRFLSCDTFWGSAAAKVSHSPKAEAADPLPAIVDFQKQLKGRGIELLLVPVPPKAAVYPDKLLTTAPVAESAAIAPLEHFYAELAENGVDVLDLAPLFAAQRSGADALFCKTDTHWSGAGCVLAAKAIAERVRSRISIPVDAVSDSFVTNWVETELVGDLVSLLPAGVPKPGKESLRLRQVTKAGAAIQPDPNSPVLLLGDSHTLVFHDFAGERAGLLDQMAVELGCIPDLIGTRGSGATAVRVSLYRKSIKDPEYLSKKKVVVWCFTAREFTESDQGWAKLPV